MFLPSNTNFNIVNVDNVQYILIKDNSHLRYNLNKTSDKYYTYKISKDNNHNYIEDISKTKKRLCCHCGYKLNYNIIGNDDYNKIIKILDNEYEKNGNNKFLKHVFYNLFNKGKN